MQGEAWMGKSKERVSGVYRRKDRDIIQCSKKRSKIFTEKYDKIHNLT